MIKNKVEQGTGEWHQMRKGKITGTTLKAIMGTPRAKEEAMYELIAERLTIGIEEDGDYENAMARGLRLEPDAISHFELEYNKSVERIGFAQDDTNPLIANSPDGLIGDTEAIEVKCMGGKNHVKMWLTNEIPDDYKWQVIQYFIVNEKLEKLYFVGYNPEIPIHQMHVIEVIRSDIQENIDKAKVEQEIFLINVENILSKLIPEL